MKLSRLPLFLSFLLALVLTACSIEQNTITSNFFHNLTAHYNGYFYAKEGAREVEKMILKSLDDDHNKILLLYPRLDTVLAKTYKKNTEEIIKMASKSIQYHPNSRWVNDNYLMVGLARLYACDYQNAILTFKYVNTKSQNIHLRHAALLNLVRTFTEMGDHDRAEEAFHFLEKEKLNRTNQKKLYLEKANYYQTRGDYNNMVSNLSKADSLLTRQDRKGRIYFIVGQVYQKLNFNAEAYNYYKKCLATNPDYEIDFYARLNMAQVAQLENKKDVRLVRKQFDKLLKDSKNQEFKDKIYFELGEFEKKQGHLTEAISEYKLAAHAGKNKRVQGMSFLRIGQINFDSLKKYKPAKLYYDSAVASLPKDFENIDNIKKRQSILGEFVKYTETITLNDSLLALSTLDTTALHRRLDSISKTKEKKTIASKKKKKKTVVSDNPSANNSLTGNPAGDSNTSDWYFGSPDLIATGQSEFQRIWGSIPLEDNWRRSGRSASLNDPTQTVAQTNIKTPPRPDDKQNIKPEAKVDVVAELYAQLPHTDDQRKELLGKIEDAYFHLGDLYYFNLNEKDNASVSYEKLLSRFPQSERTPEVLYKLYLIHREKGDGLADSYAERLQKDFPTSTFARILINPDYIKETTALAEKQKLIYKEAYSQFQQNKLKAAMDKVNEALALGETSFTSQIELLKILITGRTEDVTRYQFELGEFINKYPKDPLKKYAEQLVASSKTLLDKLEKAKGIKFSSTLTGPHFFVVIYNSADRITNPVVDALEKFNASQFPKLKLTTSNIGMDEKTLTMCVEFPDKESVMSYYYKFLDEVAVAKPFSNYKFYNFVITKDNFQIFYRTKSLDEYLTFFDKNYQK
ncbi:MAG: tetratricopeptide repeat protein [Bacteroidetes bacterium]|nr:tetratricopeptide repeat protein [Bacteroidota bacterium]